VQVFGRDEIEHVIGIAVSMVRVLARHITLHIVDLADCRFHVHAFQPMAGHQGCETVGREVGNMLPVEGSRFVADQPSSQAFHIGHHDEQ